MSQLRLMNTTIGRSKFQLVILVFALLACSSGVHAWDHPSHMTTAAIAFAEIERARPELIEKIGLILLAHPDPSPFWVMVSDAKGKERVRRMFIEAARWPDDAKGTMHDRPTWHTARWAVVAKDAPPEAKAAAAARKGRPAGHAIEALVLNSAMLSDIETNPTERASALSWVLHMVGDIHQPLHVSDLFSKEFPAGNAAGTLEWVADPMGKSAMPLHMLWDSNTLRSTKLEEIGRHAREFVEKYPRSSFPELAAHGESDAFEKWARESYKVAVDFAYGYGIETVSDPDKDLDPDKAVKKMVKYILEGVSPVEEAPEVPAEYWEKLKDVAHRRITLAGYRIADLIISAADQIAAERALTGRALDTVD
jgi:hypothetical protein